MKKLHFLLIILLSALIFAGSGVALKSDLINSGSNSKISIDNQETTRVEKGINNSENTDIEIARRGCCSHHGGVCGCNEATDRVICCDGTYSPTCTCSGY